MKKHLELWLVRHGETIANAEHRISGWSDVPLSEIGLAQARQVASLLSDTCFDEVWASDLIRAVHTAQIAFGEPRVDNRLREMHFGEMENKPFATADPILTRALLEFDGFNPPGGETLVTFRTRLTDFIDSLDPGRHLIFTHGGVIRMLTRDLGNDRFVPNTSLVRLDWTRRRLISITNPVQLTQ